MFWEVCHLGLFEVKHTYVIHGSTVADLNAWIVVLCSEHEEYRETVDLTY